MKLLLVIIASFSMTFNINAAENASHSEDMPHGFKLGNADKGSELVATCSACHGSDGNSINSDWPKLLVKTRDMYTNNFNTLKMAKEIMLL